MYFYIKKVTARIKTVAARIETMNQDINDKLSTVFRILEAQSNF